MPSAEVGRRSAQKPRLELLTIGAVVDPIARGGDPLAGRNGRRVPNHGHDIAMPSRLGPQDAEAIFGIVIGDALDEARQNFLIQCCRMRFHIHQVIDACAEPASPTAGQSPRTRY